MFRLCITWRNFRLGFLPQAGPRNMGHTTLASTNWWRSLGVSFYNNNTTPSERKSSCHEDSLVGWPLLSIFQSGALQPLSLPMRSDLRCFSASDFRPSASACCCPCPTLWDTTWEPCRYSSDLIPFAWLWLLLVKGMGTPWSILPRGLLEDLPPRAASQSSSRLSDVHDGTASFCEIWDSPAWMWYLAFLYCLINVCSVHMRASPRISQPKNIWSQHFYLPSQVELLGGPPSRYNSTCPRNSSIPTPLP